jgi:release factor glutamine methyltransferase
VETDQAVVARLRAAGCVFAEEEAALLSGAAGTPAELAAMVERRAAGEPLEQVVGWADFDGLWILVDPGVFVPRRRSEFLVQVAVRLAARPDGGVPRVIADLCCGTGALGLAVASELVRSVEAAGAAGADAADAADAAARTDAAAERDAGRPAPVRVRFSGIELHAADLDPAAVACARRNVEPAGGQVYAGDLFGALPESLRGRIDVLICNAPYVPTPEIAFMPAEAREHEAPMALDGGTDGLAVLRRVTAEAPGWLAPGGIVLVETSERQAPAMAAAMTTAGLAAQVHEDDESGATVVTGVSVCDSAGSADRDSGSVRGL